MHWRLHYAKPFVKYKIEKKVKIWYSMNKKNLFFATLPYNPQKACERCSSAIVAKFWKKKSSSYRLPKQLTKFWFQEILGVKNNQDDMNYD
jgi:hypothetical protein